MTYNRISIETVSVRSKYWMTTWSMSLVLFFSPRKIISLLGRAFRSRGSERAGRIYHRAGLQRAG